MRNRANRAHLPRGHTGSPVTRRSLSTAREEATGIA